jgi:hypothetical protein
MPHPLVGCGVDCRKARRQAERVEPRFAAKDIF